MYRQLLGALSLALALASTGADAADAPKASAPGSGAGAWRSARWGMTPDEILAAFPKEAFRLTPEVKLADGNVVAAGIDGFAFEGLDFDVRFIFTGGRLALVSLRTPQRKSVDPEAYARLREALVKTWGTPLEETNSKDFIDQRQTRWNRGADRADLKYIPGVVAIIHYPRPAAQ